MILDMDERMIVIGSFRYYLGRMTISVWAYTEWLKKNWDKLDEGTRFIIERELEEAFKRDDEDRETYLRKKEAGEDATFYSGRLGHDCDRDSWKGIRALYFNPIWCVYYRRGGDDHGDGWCALKTDKAPSARATSVSTLCKHKVILPWGIERRRPTCRVCCNTLGIQVRAW